MTTRRRFLALLGSVSALPFLGTAGVSHHTITTGSVSLATGGDLTVTAPGWHLWVIRNASGARDLLATPTDELPELPNSPGWEIDSYAGSVATVAQNGDIRSAFPNDITKRIDAS